MSSVLSAQLTQGSTSESVNRDPRSVSLSGDSRGLHNKAPSGENQWQRHEQEKGRVESDIESNAVAEGHELINHEPHDHAGSDAVPCPWFLCLEGVVRDEGDEHAPTGHCCSENSVDEGLEFPCCGSRLGDAPERRIDLVVEDDVHQSRLTEHRERKPEGNNVEPEADQPLLPESETTHVSPFPCSLQMCDTRARSYVRPVS